MGKQLSTSAHGQRLLRSLAGVLPAEEQTVVLGDLEEEGTSLLSSLGAVLGYAVRRELLLWASIDSWLILLLVVLPCGVMLGSVSQSMADGNAIYVWFFANNVDSSLLHQGSFWVGLREQIPGIVVSSLALIAWSWCCGALIGLIARRSLKVHGLFLFLPFLGIWLGWRPPTVDFQTLPLARDFPGNAAIFSNVFYRTFFVPIVQIVFVLIPLARGLQNQRVTTLRALWARQLFWVGAGITLASLLAQASLWWQTRTWTTYPALTPHLPSVVPLAATGAVPYSFLRLISRFRAGQTVKTSDMQGDRLV